MTAAPRHLLAAVLAGAVLLGSTAPAGAAGTPPYQLTTGAPGVLTASPAAGATTLAVTAVRNVFDGTIVFSPAAASAPGSCASAADRTVCPPSLMSGTLQMTGDQLDVTVNGVITATLRIVGGADTDTIDVVGPITGEVTQLVLDPGAGNDAVSILGRVRTVSLAADPGDDRYSVGLSIPQANTISLGAGNDVASSTSSTVTFNGGDGDDTLIGRGPLVGGPGNDVLEPDALGMPAVGGDEAGDVDRLSYERVTTPLTLTRADVGMVAVAGDAVMKTGVDILEGGQGNDTITGHDGPDVLFGGGGDDTIAGLGGGDVLDGGPGVNTLSYEASSSPVVLDLGAGTAFTGGAGDSVSGFRRILTGSGSDSVTGTAADETFSLGAGNDQLTAGPGNDAINAGPGDDMLRGGIGADIIDGGEGRDVANYDERGPSEPLNITLMTLGGDGAAGENDTLASIEDVFGGASNDTLVGDNGPNLLVGGPGVNTLTGLAGDDDIRGGDGRDVISGGPGSDRLSGAGDDDSIDAFAEPKPDVDVVNCGDSPDDDAQVDPDDMVTACEYSRRGDVPVPVDADGDGFIAGFDCRDDNAAINPAAEDTPLDGIDQDCDGFDATLPFVDYRVRGGISRLARGGIRFTRLVVVGLGPTYRVEISCRNPPRRKICFKKTSRPAKAGQVSFTSLLKSRLLPPDARVELRITAPGFNGRVRRYAVRQSGYRESNLCLMGRSTTPRPCPVGDEL